MRKPTTQTSHFLTLPNCTLESIESKNTTMNFSTPWFKNSWLKSLGLKGPGLKLGVEKSGVEMSFNRNGSGSKLLQSQPFNACILLLFSKSTHF